jgi:hypothetical protein
MPDLAQVGEDFGYRFEPVCAADAPCHRKLTVVLRAEANDQHFDAEKLDCFAVNTQGDIDNLVVAHPWPFLDQYRVAAGRVTIIERGSQNKAQAFTFGSTLHLEQAADRVTALLESPAPVLALLPENPFLSRVAAQCEALLAERRAAWDMQGKRDEFERRLAKAEPAALYQAILQALAQSLAAGAVFGGPADKKLEKLLAAERRAGEAPALEDIL